MTSARAFLLLAALAALALPAAAQTLYKLIDKNGKVTYAEKPPKDFDGKVIRMDIDPNANTAVLPKPGAAAAGGEGVSRDTETLRRDVQKRTAIEERIERARLRLENLKLRLQDMIDNPNDADVVRAGKLGGGTRPVFTDEYQARLERAQADVKAAEEELARLESER